MSVREKKWPALNKECNYCQGKGHFKVKCRKANAMVESIKVSQKKANMCSVVMTKKQKHHTIVKLVDRSGNSYD